MHFQFTTFSIYYELIKDLTILNQGRSVFGRNVEALSELSRFSV